MLTYRDLRKEKKGIVLLCIEAFSIIGLVLYEYFFEIHILCSETFLTNFKASNGLFKLVFIILIFTLLSYFFYYSKILGFLYQVGSAFPLGFIVSDLISINIFLSIGCSAIFTIGWYYFQIMRPIHQSNKQYLNDQQANGVTQYKYLGHVPNGQKRMNRLLDRYDSLNNKAMHIFSNMRSSGKKYPEQFTFISKQVLSIKNLILVDLKDLCEANDEDFEEIYSDILISIDELDADVSSLHTLFNLHLSNPKPQDKHTSSSKTIPHKKQNDSFDFFLGCEDLITLKKRYRDLMKTYHSDEMAGNELISSDINIAYEKAKNRLS